jgi:hypothetical protein
MREVLFGGAPTARIGEGLPGLPGARVMAGGGAGGVVLLENIAVYAALAGQRPVPVVDYRAERWAARGVLWYESALPRVRGCGRYTISRHGEVEVRSDGQSQGFAGLASCGSPWLEPVCAAKIWAERRLELGVLLAAVVAAGDGAAFGAMTVRHHLGTPLVEVWDGLLGCWRALGKDLTVRKVRKRCGVVGVIRLVECTCGDNGWHPHVHLLVIFDHVPTAEEVAAVHAAHVAVWLRAAARLGLDTPTEGAQDLHLVTGRDIASDLAEYLGKSGQYTPAEAVAFEMTGSAMKSARSVKGRSPMDLLRAVVDDGDADALDLLHEFERISKGRRALTWGRGLRARYGVGAERDDEEIAAAEVGTKRDTVLTVTDWSPVAASPRLGAGLLAAVHKDGQAGGVAFCRANGIDYREEGAR